MRHLIILLYLLSTNVHADDKSDLLKAKQEISILKDINDLQKKNSDIDADKISLLSKQNDSLAEKLGNANEMRTWEKIAWVTLGVLATVGGAAALSKVGH